jgi:hypothetical protein
VVVCLLGRRRQEDVRVKQCLWVAERSERYSVQRATRVGESMMMVASAVAGGSGGVVVSVGRDNWEGPRVAGASERLGWLAAT